MTNPNPGVLAPDEEQLRQLAHDARAYLSIVMTGMYALSAVREDESQFAEMCETIQLQGAEPLKRCLEALIVKAHENRAG